MNGPESPPTAHHPAVMSHPDAGPIGCDSPLIVGNRFDIELSEEALVLVGDLLVRSRNSLSELLIKSLVLYKVALDAQAEGNHLAIVNSEGEVDRDIIGI
jgi:hypothetical protein